MREYLTSLEVLALHQALLTRYGGAPGIRDMGAVEAAVFRPQCGYYKDIVEEAAALLESLLINYPFVDGNKRTAYVVCLLFLRLHSVRINAPAPQRVILFERLGNGEVTQDALAGWLRAHG